MAHRCNRSLDYDIYKGSAKSKFIWLAWTSYPNCLGRNFLWGFVCFTCGNLFSKPTSLSLCDMKINYFQALLYNTKD